MVLMIFAILIHSADPQSLFLYVRPFQHLAKQNKCQAKTMFTNGETVALTERIIDDLFSEISSRKRKTS